jgi:hypothetical protein
VLLSDQPLLSDFYGAREEIELASGSLYVYQRSGEERSANQDRWLADQEVTSLELRAVAGSSTLLDIGERRRAPLRNRAELQALWTATEAQEICVDLTGIRNDVWAPLLRAALDAGLRVKALYVEPAEYRFAAKPRRGELFQLSDRREGLDQIPGFAALDAPGSETASVFVPLLGFEGARALHAFDELEPRSEDVVPIVGAPGFRVEYPMHTYQGNELFLEQGEHHTQITYAIANCPFAVYYRLEEIAGDYPAALLRIAILGTKPHALGAVLYAIAQEGRRREDRRRVGLIHDRPVVNPVGKRTTGTAHALLYDVSTFIEQVP